MKKPELQRLAEAVGEEWMEWYRLSPKARWQHSERLWAFFLSAGGTLDSEPDSQSPFDFLRACSPGAAHGRPGVRVIRRW